MYLFNLLVIAGIIIITHSTPPPPLDTDSDDRIARLQQFMDEAGLTGEDRARFLRDMGEDIDSFMALQEPDMTATQEPEMSTIPPTAVRGTYEEQQKFAQFLNGVDLSNEDMALVEDFIDRVGLTERHKESLYMRREDAIVQRGPDISITVNASDEDTFKFAQYITGENLSDEDMKMVEKLIHSSNFTTETISTIYNERDRALRKRDLGMHPDEIVRQTNSPSAPSQSGQDLGAGMEVSRQQVDDERAVILQFLDEAGLTGEARRQALRDMGKNPDQYPEGQSKGEIMTPFYLYECILALVSVVHLI